MLPTHDFADVVGFLHLHELDALLLTDARCSRLAQSAASRIRVFNFSEFHIAVYYAIIDIYNLAIGQAAPNVTELKFLDEEDLADFVPAALRNCVFGNLTPRFKGSCDAMREVTHTIVVKGTLFLYADEFACVHSLVKFAVSFRSVRIVHVVDLHACKDSQIKELVNLFDHHGFVDPEIDRVGRAWSASFVSRSA